MAVGQRQDPYASFRFLVEIDGQTVGGFAEVSGLQAEIETEDYWEGGVNESVHKLVKGTKYPNLVLKRGLTDSQTLWEWHADAVSGRIARKTCRVVLLDSQGQEKWHWVFEEAFPVKWVGPEMKADGSAVAVETLELVHSGMAKG
jgi:phage tail-like protein